MNDDIHRINEQKSKPKYAGVEQQQYETLVRMSDVGGMHVVVADLQQLGENHIFRRYKKYLIDGSSKEIWGLIRFVHNHASELK